MPAVSKDLNRQRKNRVEIKTDHDCLEMREAGVPQTGSVSITAATSTTTTATKTTTTTKTATTTTTSNCATAVDVQKQKLSGWILSWRFVIGLLLHTSFSVMVFLRGNMSLAVVCMASTSESSEADGNTTSRQDVNETKSEEEFVWESNFQGLVLSSVSFLSCIAPFLTNALKPLLGLKSTLCFLTVVSLALTLLIPVATRINVWLLVALRILIGGTLGSNVPVVGEVIAWWSPNGESQTLISLAFSGVQTGAILTSLISGYLCIIPVDNGWPFIFYFTGGIAIMWVILWQLLASSKPENHKYISQQELQYIQQHRQLRKESGDKRSKPKVPYKKIMTSFPFAAFLVCCILHHWMTELFYTYQGVFLSDVLGFSPSEAGVIISVYSLVRLLGMAFWVVFFNNLRSRTKMSKTAVMKISISTGMVTCIGAQVAVVFLSTEERWMVVGLLVGVLFCLTSTGSLLPAIPQDMAPRYAGFLTGLFFSIVNLVGISSPLIVAAITPNNTFAEWNIVWIIISVVCFCLLLVFAIFGDCSLQPWAEEGQENKPEELTSSNSRQKRGSFDGPTVPNSASRVEGEGSESPHEDCASIITTRDFPIKTRENKKVKLNSNGTDNKAFEGDFSQH